MGWAAQGDTDVADAKTSPPQFGGRDGLDIFNCFTEHSSFQARKVEALRQSRTDALAIASRVTCAAHGASSGHALAVPQNSLLGTETNYGHPRGLVVLLLVILIFIPHESKSPPSHDEMPSEMFRTRRSLHPQPDYSAREAAPGKRSTGLDQFLGLKFAWQIPSAQSGARRHCRTHNRRAQGLRSREPLPASAPPRTRTRPATPDRRFRARH